MNWQNFRAVKCDFLTIFLFFRPRVCNLAYDFAPMRVLYTLIYMYEKTRGIVLHVIKYSDKNSIAHVYTDTHGRMAFLLPQGATRAARMRNAMFMPLSVLGGAAVIMFSMIVVSGIQALGREKMDERTGLIIALSLGLGVGIGNIPSVLAQLPEWVNMIFAQNSIIMTFVVATVLNLILPKKKAPEPAAKQDQA